MTGGRGLGEVGGRRGRGSFGNPRCRLAASGAQIIGLSTALPNAINVLLTFRTTAHTGMDMAQFGWGSRPADGGQFPSAELAGRSCRATVPWGTRPRVAGLPP